MKVEAQTNGNDRPTIERGEVAFSVPHQLPGQSFSVIAGPYRIVVVGTKFRLRVEGAHVAVAVDEGVVEIWRRNRLARLVPGDSWSSPQETPARAAAGSSASAANDSSKTRPPVAASEAAPPRTEPPAPRAPVTDPAPEARAALAAGEPHRALETYRAVAARGGPAAENAEYEIGRILRDRLGQPEDAIAAWRRYRSLHPDGLLRVETDVSIIETLVSAGDSTVALAEANDFLRRHPDSERRGEIARVAGDLYRARGDCAHAVVAYQTALSAQRSRETAEYAAFHRAACLVRLGDSSANDALQAYLRSWPSGRFRGNANRLLRGATDHASAP
jgi:tetratricopeptide (TPR) repeat protein